MFNLPLRSYQRDIHLKRSDSRVRKRKRIGSPATQQQRPSGVQDREGRNSPRGSLSPLQQASSAAVLTPDEIYQYSVAGQSVEDQRPDHPFPHAASSCGIGPARFACKLQQQSKPAHTSTQGEENLSENRTLHQQHLAVMMAILHRALLEEDFGRASRALAMILRDQTGGLPSDIRSEGNWGIGAEILLRQDARQLHAHRGQSDSGPDKQQSGARERSQLWFTRKGFEDAKKYYERLIVQYPLRRQTPTTVNALDFYSAMFGLWVYVVHWECQLKALGVPSMRDDSAGQHPWSHDDTTGPVVRSSATHELIGQELTQAREIADRMDSVMSSLPYREHFELIELRRMVQLWTCDLEEMLPNLDSTESD